MWLDLSRDYDWIIQGSRHNYPEFPVLGETILQFSITTFCINTHLRSLLHFVLSHSTWPIF